MIECTGLAVRDDVGWIALCPEYDIASEGASSSEALMRLQFKIQKAVELAQEHKLAIGRPVSEEALAVYLASHRGEQRGLRWHYHIDSDGPSVYAVLGEPI